MEKRIIAYGLVLLLIAQYACSEEETTTTTILHVTTTISPPASTTVPSTTISSSCRELRAVSNGSCVGKPITILVTEGNPNKPKTVREARVAVYSATTKDLVTEKITNDVGIATFTPSKTGSYDLKIRKREYCSTDITLDVSLCSKTPQNESPEQETTTSTTTSSTSTSTTSTLTQTSTSSTTVPETTSTSSSTTTSSVSKASEEANMPQEETTPEIQNKTGGWLGIIVVVAVVMIILYAYALQKNKETPKKKKTRLESI